MFSLSGALGVTVNGSPCAKLDIKNESRTASTWDDIDGELGPLRCVS